MYHWYLLCKDLTRPASPAGSDIQPGFVVGGGPRWSDFTPHRVRLRLFILGAVEALPLGGGIGLGSYFEPAIPYSATAAVGLALSVLLCWLLRSQTPETVIHVVQDSADDS